MSARLRKESDAISNGLGRLTLLADEKITEQKQEFTKKPALSSKRSFRHSALSFRRSTKNTVRRWKTAV